MPISSPGGGPPERGGQEGQEVLLHPPFRRCNFQGPCQWQLQRPLELWAQALGFGREGVGVGGEGFEFIWGLMWNARPMNGEASSMMCLGLCGGKVVGIQHEKWD
jgi:hypothetical protein